uniref:Uncharacterized protein n=1 Tax=Lactuca sativa TaxID=4236 RepID=A0A9R1XDQ0_LACSA|nr:hypothetical protein LSAT_V11C400205150 [Lactuca sativa]
MSLEPNLEIPFPVYPLVSSIETLVRMQHRRILIDIVGKVISGRLLGHHFAIEMTLQDQSGFVINLILNLTPEASPAMLARAIVYQWVIYVSQVKFCEQGGVNYLFSTYISRVSFHPIMTEAELIRIMLG